MVEANDGSELQKYRDEFSPAFVLQSRKLMASMKTEESFDRLSKEVSANGLVSKGPRTDASDGDLRIVIEDLWRISRSRHSRVLFRERIGISRLGELSSLMKAAMSDEEIKQYLKSQSLLERIRSANG
jgi:hypothetical protein